MQKISTKIDDVVERLYESHEVGSIIKSTGSIPCSICRSMLEQGVQLLIRDHFHGSDFGACARKVWYQMSLGMRASFSNTTFLMDGHLHEASMLQNIQAGLPEQWEIKILENQHEEITEICGFKIVTHCDAFLLDHSKSEVYILECKAVKDKNFPIVKGKMELDRLQSLPIWYGQNQCYLLVAKSEIAYLIIKNRDTSKIILPLRIDKDMDYISQRLNKLVDIHNKIKNNSGQFSSEAKKISGSIPEREHMNPKDYECQFCSFKKECWND